MLTQKLPNHPNTTCSANCPHQAQNPNGMSFLAGRLAATEGAYFLQESKHAAGRLAHKLPPTSAAAGERSPPSAAADVLPEILRHAVPIKAAPPASDPSLSASSRWAVPSGANAAGASPDALNPLRAFVSLPQATFGPKRWQLPNEQPQYCASTANDLRRERYPPPMDPDKLKAVVAGYSQVGKAFVVATIMVFGGATALLLYTAHKLQLHSADDIRTKGRDAIQTQADMLRERIVPLRTWAEDMSRKWHIEGDKEAKEKSAIIKELSKVVGARTPN